MASKANQEADSMRREAIEARGMVSKANEEVEALQREASGLEWCPFLDSIVATASGA